MSTDSTAQVESARLRNEQGNVHVLLDNGAAENGVPIEAEDLFTLARMLNATEVVLPDTLGDAEATKREGFKAIQKGQRINRTFDYMAVPQGSTPSEWRRCLRAMLDWPVRSIGISKFLTGGIYPDRRIALEHVPELLESEKEIHLLGASDLKEVVKINRVFPERIRGVDSAIASIYTIEGEYLSSGKPRPNVEMDFLDGAHLNPDLLATNKRFWIEKTTDSRLH